jgi:hypothetical protein
MITVLTSEQVLAGVIGSGSHSWRNQNKNATDSTDSTDLPKILDHVLGPTSLSTASSLEIKARTTLIAEHHAQALHNLTATRLRLALLLNFGTRSLQSKRIIRQAFLNPWNPWRFCFLAQFALKAAASY